MDAKKLLIGAAATGVAALIAYGVITSQGGEKKEQAPIKLEDQEDVQKLISKFESGEGFIGICGDVRGTTVRLELVRLFHNTQKKEVIIALKKYDAQNVDKDGSHLTGL